MIEPEQRRVCNIYYKSEKFIAVMTMSGWGMLHADPKGIDCLLAPDVSDFELGSTILAALAKSRIVHPDEDPDLVDSAKGDERYRAWVKHLMRTYGYKTKTALFTGMLSCSIKVQADQMEMRPNKREGREGFGPTPQGAKDNVYLSATAQPEEVGAAARLTLSRCIG